MTNPIPSLVERLIEDADGIEMTADERNFPPHLLERTQRYEEHAREAATALQSQALRIEELEGELNTANGALLLVKHERVVVTQRAKALQAQLDTYRDALETFAILVSEDHDHLPDELVVSLTYDSTDHDEELGGPNELLGERLLRAFRVARAALNPEPPAEAHHGLEGAE